MAAAHGLCNGEDTSLDFFVSHPTAFVIGGGFLIGFLVGLTGVGAGALTTPMLITGVGMPPALAVGTDLLFAAITKSSAAFRHHKLFNVDWHIVRWLAAGSLPGAAGMLAWLFLAQPDTHVLAVTIRHGLAFALFISAAAIAFYPWLLSYRVPVDHDTGPPGRGLREWATLAFGLVVGVLVTLTSVGAGSIGVTVLTSLYPALLARRVVGTDIVHAIPLTLLSGLGHAKLGNVDFSVLGFLLIGSIPGIALGSRVTGVLPDWVLRLALSAVLVNAGWLMLPKG